MCYVLYLGASVMSDSATLWTIAHQSLLSVGFSRQECWSGLPCPPPRNLLDSGIEPHLLHLLHCRWTLPLSHWGNPVCVISVIY